MKFIFIFFIGAVISFSASAQKLYLDLGAGFSKLHVSFIDRSYSWQEYETASRNTAVFAGVEFQQQQNYSLTTDIGLLQLGAINEKPYDSIWSQPLPDRIFMNYLSINPAVNLALLNKKTKIKLFAGPRLDLLLGTGNSEGNESWFLREARKVYLGYTSGIGVFYNIRNVEFGIKGRMNSQTKDFVDVEPTRQPSRIGYHVSAIHNFSVTFSVGYLFSKPE